MSRIDVVPWDKLARENWRALLLGNGASIALHAGFRYGSLLDVAKGNGLLPTTQPVFAAYRTSDFEYVLQAMWHASIVNGALGTPSAAIGAAYSEVRDALIGAVHTVHCDHDALTLAFPNLVAFLKRFETVATFNYDVTLYWTMIEGNQSLGTWFKDGFVGLGNTFDPAWQRLRTPYGATGTTMVFFGHGSMILGRDPLGQESKLTANQVAPGWKGELLNTVEQAWMSGTHAPVFVSEGTAAEKLGSIGRSMYLRRVHSQVLPHLGDSLVFYGFSFADNDDHVLEALARKQPPKLVAVSVFTGAPDGDQQAFCHHVLKKTASWKNCQVKFFDHASSGCWNNP
jgi:hypothetical protein